MEIIESKKKNEEHCYARNHKFSVYLVLRTVKSYRIISTSQKLSANSKVFLATLQLCGIAFSTYGREGGGGVEN